MSHRTLRTLAVDCCSVVVVDAILADADTAFVRVDDDRRPSVCDARHTCLHDSVCLNSPLDVPPAAAYRHSGSCEDHPVLVVVRMTHIHNHNPRV